MKMQQNQTGQVTSVLRATVVALAMLLGLGSILASIFAAFNGDAVSFLTRILPGIFLTGVLSWGLRASSR
jgi:polyferredoxin